MSSYPEWNKQDQHGAGAHHCQRDDQQLAAVLSGNFPGPQEQRVRVPSFTRFLVSNTIPFKGFRDQKPERLVAWTFLLGAMLVELRFRFGAGGLLQQPPERFPWKGLCESARRLGSGLKKTSPPMGELGDMRRPNLYTCTHSP